MRCCASTVLQVLLIIGRGVKGSWCSGSYQLRLSRFSSVPSPRACNKMEGEGLCLLPSALPPTRRGSRCPSLCSNIPS
ncbi:hypothetical protein HOY82DRAFT_26131 [Tuber indicum]|nr:hypothetical protein HOY82DRAFT_26131 [Tuber indicum]